MPDRAATTDIVRRYLKARIPLIVINSMEAKRVLDIVDHVASEMSSLVFFEYSAAEGLRGFPRGKPVLNDLSLLSTLDHVRNAFKSRLNVNFVFTDMDNLDTDSTTARHFAQIVRIAELNQGSVILIVDQPVWPGLARLGMTVRLDLPTVPELVHLVNKMIEVHRDAIAIEWQTAEVHRAAETLSGLSQGEALNVLATVLASGELKNSDIAQLAHFKNSVLGDLTGIERVMVLDRYRVGGLSRLKQWLRQREVLMKTDLSESRLRPPRGVLLCGVPGCGKSLSAKAIAQEWQLPLYRLDMGAIMGMYVGESERNLREALATADRVAPCVLWIDEIEKGLAVSAADNSVTRRLIGQFLFWLQESTSKVFLVATANDVASLTPELLRKGRFDEVFFVDLPTAEERAEIITMSFDYYIEHDVDSVLLDRLVDLSEGFSGSDIDSAVHEIASIMLADGVHQAPDAAAVMAVFERIIPFSRSHPEQVEQIRQWGKTRAVPAG